MDNNVQNTINNQTQNETEVDLGRIFKLLWQKIGIILLVGVIGLAAGYTYSRFFLKEQYSSSIILYVNNNKDESGKAISSSDITASKNLVNTYIVILKNRTTMEMLREVTGVDYNYKQLLGMISASAVNDTEAFSVTVTCGDAKMAQKLAQSIGEILPSRVNETIDGTSMKVVDNAALNEGKVGPNNGRNAIIGFIIGVVLVCGIVILRDLFDSTVRDDDYVIEKLGIPVLARIPDLQGEGSGKYYSKYGRYRRYGRYSKYGK